MLKIGLTGGIGSGKTQVTNQLQALGATIVDTDVIAHRLTHPQGAAIEAIRTQFGAEFIQADGSMNRALMRSVVFNQPQQRQRLEAILHPLIRQAAQSAIISAQGLYTVVVVPLLAEHPEWVRWVDRVCVVDCDAATQLKRVQQRTGLSLEQAQQMVQAQASRAQRLALADDIILNDVATDVATLQARVLRQHQHWLTLRP